MKGNVTGGILLFTLGAIIIVMGVSEKGKKIFNILTGDSSGTTLENPYKDDLEKEGTPSSDSSDDPEWKEQSPSGDYEYGFAGEKGAKYVG